MKHLSKIGGISFTILLFITCVEIPEQPEFNNPYFPNDPSYVPPEVYITDGPRDGDIVYSPYVSFWFEGNEMVSEYSYKMDEEKWSGWSASNEAAFESLGEGLHTFRVKGRNKAGVENENYSSRYFEVDAIQGPALWFSPRDQAVATGDTFRVKIMAEDMEDVMGLRIPVVYGGSPVELVDYKIFRSDTTFLRQNSGSVIGIVDTLDVYGTYIFNIAVVDGEPEGVSGAGPILALTFRANSPISTSIQFDYDCLYKDSQLYDYYFASDQLLPAVVEVY